MVRGMPEPLADEEQVPLILRGATWMQYEAMADLFSRLGNGLRVRFLRGELEIRPPACGEREARTAILSRLVELFCTSRRIRYFVRGSLAVEAPVAGVAGGRPDEAFSFWEKKQVPDLVLEVVVASGGLSKRLFWQALAIPEVWIWQRHYLEVLVWDEENARHEPAKESRVLPGLDLRLLAACARLGDPGEALAEFRRGLVG